LSSTWREIPLNDLVVDIFDRRGLTPRKLGSDFIDSGHRVISAKHIKGRRIDLSAGEDRFVDEQIYRKWMAAPLLEGDVILTSEAPLAEPAYVTDRREWCIGQRLFAIRSDAELLSGRFLFYALQSRKVRHDILSRATGTTVAGIRQPELRRVLIPVPSVPEQRAIAHVLGTIDDKIELNRKMNETLEELARTIFKSWFVDFGPVRAKSEGRQPFGMNAETAALFPDSFDESELGPIPKGWNVARLSDRVELLSGGTPKTSISEYWNGSIPWIAAADTAAGPFVIDTQKHISDLGVQKSATKILPIHTVVITARGTVGNLVISGAEMAMNQSCYGVRGTGSLGQFTVYCLLRSEVAKLKFMVHGTIFDTITRETFARIVTIEPPPILQERFEAMIANMFELALSNQLENRSLAKLRDTLLPRLISGELRIHDAENLLAEAPV
jgi:type I restriction enzyme, S subunit